MAESNKKRKMATLADDVAAIDKVYFDGYLDHTVHKKMLGDATRMNAYRAAVEANVHLFKDKVVLDIGAGTGILSLLSAKAGAKRVFAVEASAMASDCRKTVEENGFGEVITVVNSKVEDIGDKLPGDVTKVDVIISEWMGLLLVQESVLDSVLWARDHFLAEDGVLFPSHARIYFCPASLSKELAVWDDVLGFKFEPLKRRAKEQLLLTSPLRRTLSGDDLMATKPMLFKYFNLKTMQVSSVRSMRSTLPFTLKGPFDAIAVWFDVRFAYGTNSEDSGSGKDVIVLSTSPTEPFTHWEQAVVVLPQTVPTPEGAVVKIGCVMSQSEENFRHYEIGFEIPRF